MSFNWFDLALGFLILMSGISGLRSGLARVVVGLIAMIAGIIAGFWCYRLVAAKLTPYISSVTAANILGFFAIFLAVVLLGSLVAALLSRIFRWIGLSWFNHFLGGVAGLLRGVLVVAVLANILIAFSPSPAPSYLENSRVLPYASQVAATLVEIAPRELKDSFTQQWGKLKQLWSEPAARPAPVVPSKA
ncbi:MAG: CvpA family protein [Acidobacteriaceae bacterium]|nr:CvpA family protein [Acidobacteriaceae bacterium]